LPVSVFGTEAVLPAKGTRVEDGHSVKVVVLPPVDPSAYDKKLNDLMAEVRSRLMSGLAG
jgi:hypothetical protein